MKMKIASSFRRRYEYDFWWPVLGRQGSSEEYDLRSALGYVQMLNERSSCRRIVGPRQLH